MILKKIYKRKLQKYRNQIDQVLHQVVESKIEDEEILQMVEYALESGRRFRPLLFILTYKIFDSNVSQEAFQMAAGAELLHKASLIHDDLLDDDQYRRGKVSFCHKYDEKMAVIIGDLLVSLAFETFIGATNDPFLTSKWTALYRKLATGETRDLLWEQDWQISEEKVNEMIYGKTASFLEFVMEAGTYLSSEDSNKSRLMGQFGKEIGFAFQIMNDLNNWRGLEEELGRQTGGDIKSGKVNPVTLLVYKNRENFSQRSKLKEYVIEEAKGLAREHINTARNLFEQLGITNKYTKVVGRILDEFDQKWFWVDNDG